MAALSLQEKIEVETNHGLCEIHLAFGSITKLEEKDKVDVLVVSAFPGDYSTTPSSVIGALQRDLGISVRNLAKNKEEDLRRLFSCWWSKPLQPNYSFERIMCFEGSFKRGSRAPMVVSEVFRSLVSMCKDKDIKVIMPILAAGDQGYSQQMMLRLIVEAAIHWMQIGLPLKVLKIVVFERNFDHINQNPVLHYFRDLKAKWIERMRKEHEEPEDHPINYDVYLSYNEEDQGLVKIVKAKLAEKHKGIRIYSEHQNLNPDVSWQDEIYQVMVTCARVITILSPRFLADEACLEQYNIALCCTRNMKRDYLAPFYIDSIEEMPTYMCLIQYVDCRPLDHEKISQACYIVINWLQSHLAELHHLTSERKTALAVAKPLVKTQYDVFISYSHQNSDVADIIQKFLSVFHPDWNIFIDITELKTGVSWQVKLYDSIESSKLVIALLSPPYIRSKVCQEEYNLASAMHSDASYETKLLPLLVEEVETLPIWCRGYTPIDCRKISDNSMMRILQKINLLLDLDNLEKPHLTSVEDVMSCWRTEHYISGLKFLANVEIDDILNFQPEKKSDSAKSNKVDIALLYHNGEEPLGRFLFERLRRYLPNATISLPEESKTRLALLDEATIIVPLLSHSFTNSAELSDELNTALCRQRVTDRLVLFPVTLGPLPSSPAYFRLLWSLLSCSDKVWTNYKLISNSKADTQFSSSQKCLDFAARVIAYVLTNLGSFQGSYKTLLSTEELLDSTLRFRAKLPVDQLSYNPLYFEMSRAGHSTNESKFKGDACHIVEDPKTSKLEDKVELSNANPIQESNPIKKSVNLAKEDYELGKPSADGQRSPSSKKTPLPNQPSEHCEDDAAISATNDSVEDQSNTKPLKATQTLQHPSDEKARSSIVMPVKENEIRSSTPSRTELPVQSNDCKAPDESKHIDEQSLSPSKGEEQMPLQNKVKIQESNQSIDGSEQKKDAGRLPSQSQVTITYKEEK